MKLGRQYENTPEKSEPDCETSDSDQMDQGDFSRLADAMAEFVESRTRISVGPIARPPIVSGRQLAFAALALLISSVSLFSYANLGFLDF